MPVGPTESVAVVVLLGMVENADVMTKRNVRDILIA